MTQEQISDYWKILNKKANLKEALIICGSSEDQADRIMDEIKAADKMYCYNYFNTASTLSYIAYQALLSEGQISPDIIYNNGFGTNEKPVFGDMGYQGNKTYRFSHGGWQFAY